jgi:hypothetical protein
MSTSSDILLIEHASILLIRKAAEAERKEIKKATRIDLSTAELQTFCTLGREQKQKRKR